MAESSMNHFLPPHFNCIFLILPRFPLRNKVGVYLNHCVLSVHSSVRLCARLCLDDISWTAQTFVNKLDVVVHHHEMKCLAERLICWLQGQGHSEGLHNQTTIISAVSSKLLILLQPNFVWWHIIIKLECCVRKFGCSVKGQGHSKSSKCQWLFAQIISPEPVNLF